MDDDEINQFILNVKDLTKLVLATGESVANSQDVGSDLSSVQQLRYHLNGIEEQLRQLQVRVESSVSKAEDLTEERPEIEPVIMSSCDGLLTAWEEMWNRVHCRRRQLSDAFDYQQFLNGYRQFSTWVQRLSDPEEMQLQLQSHEFGVRLRSLDHWLVFGQLLLESSHFASEEITRCLREISMHYNKLMLYRSR